MRAWVLRRPRSVEERPLELAEVPAPVPGADEVLIRVRACGICRTDLHVAEGELLHPRSPVIPGHQVVGEVLESGSSVGPTGTGFTVGKRVGVPWLHRTCGVCRFCRSGRENLCEKALFTGYTVDGGYAELIVAPSAFVYELPEGFDDLSAAPLLCAGIIGYRALRLTRLDAHGWRGARLGIYGFGAAGHVAIQIARGRGADVYVMTRDREKHQTLAHDLGAAWVGGAADTPPVKLDAAIIFAPAGPLVPVALGVVDRGGAVVLGGIHMSPIPEFSYDLLYGERSLASVANNTREDGRAFLAEAAGLPVRTEVHTFPMGEANEALIALKHDGIRGAGVLVFA